MQTRAKFKCVKMSVTDYNKTTKEYEFQAVCADEVPENERYHKYTPSGKLSIWVDNEAVKFELGKSYYLDITEAHE